MMLVLRRSDCRKGGNVNAIVFLALVLISPTGPALSSDSGSGTEDVEKSPISFIRVFADQPGCGKGGKTPAIFNRHPDRSIRVFMLERSVYNGQPIENRLGVWTVDARETVKLTRFCTIPGPTQQRFSYHPDWARWR